MLSCFSNEASINLGCRFSKSSTERERILQLRKEQLLMLARRRYMERHKSGVAQRDVTHKHGTTRVRHRHADSWMISIGNLSACQYASVVSIGKVATPSIHHVSYMVIGTKCRKLVAKFQWEVARILCQYVYDMSIRKLQPSFEIWSEK